MPNYCKYCGAVLKEAQKYCRQCGREIEYKKNTIENNKQQIGKIAEQITLLQQGDPVAFDRLYNLTSRFVQYTAVCCGIMGTAVEDVMQDTYLTIYRNVGKMQDPNAGLAWIKHIAFSRAMDYLRKNKQESLSVSAEDAEAGIAESVEDSFPIPEDIMENRETQRMMQDIIDGLPEDQRRIVIAYYYNECKVEDIAQEFDMPVGTVKTKLYRARAAIKVSVEDMEKKHGIRLHTVAIAPVLAFLFHEKASAAEVPAQITTAVLGSVHAAGQAVVHTGTQVAAQVGVKTAAKAGLSTAAKIAIGSIATVATVSSVSAVVYHEYFSSTPEKTLEQFEDAYNDRDVEGMFACMDEATRAQYEQLQGLFGVFGTTTQDVLDGVFYLGDELDRMQGGNGGWYPDLDIRVRDVEYDGDYASVSAEVVFGDEREMTEFSLVKEDHKWYILGD